MEESKKVENKVINKEEVKEEYVSSYGLTKEQIIKFPKLKYTMVKQQSKKTGLSSYIFVAFLYGLELRDKKFDATKFLICLLEKKKTMEEIEKLSSVDGSAYYRPIKGIRRDNGTWFFGVDIFVSGSYRVRIFFDERQLKALRYQNVSLNYVQVEELEEEVDSFEDFE